MIEFVLVDPEESKLRHVVGEESISIVHPNASQLNVKLRVVNRSLLVSCLDHLENLRGYNEILQTLLGKVRLGEILDLPITLTNLMDYKWFENGLNRDL